MRICRLSVSVWILAGLAILLGAQRTYLYVHSIVHEQEVADQNAKYYAQVLEIYRQDNMLRTKEGRLWLGDLQPAGEATNAEAVQVDTQSPTKITSPRQVVRVLPVSTDNMRVEFECHECTPGSQLCTTGGTLKLLDSQGNMILSGSLSLFNGTSTYQLDWLQPSMDEQEKLAMLKQIVAGQAALDQQDYYSILRKLYGFDQLSAGDEIEQLGNNLWMGILNKALNDRIGQFSMTSSGSFDAERQIQ